MAQQNLLVGDIDGNTDQVIESCRQAILQHQADIVVFPELTLTGYPPEDLLLRPSMQLRVNKALERVMAARLDICCVIGHPFVADSLLYNSLTVICKGQILARYHKQCLPNYQVFDERRYFTPGSESCLLELKGQKTAFTICEDLWQSGPVIQARNAGARLLVNINASPFHIGKQQERKSLLQRRSEEGDFPIVYVNLVGGQDELVFDGGSMALDADSGRCMEAPLFTEGLFPVELEFGADGRFCIETDTMPNTGSTEAQVYEALVLGVRDYVRKNRFKGVVLGLSGGIDSALTLAVAVDALGQDRVHAVMLPFEYTSELSLDCAARQARTLGVSYRVIPINAIYDAFMDALKEEFADTAEDVSEQNIQARARGVILMAISNKKGHLVLTTGNKSEIAVGYSTLYGDMAGGFDVLKDVSKTWVYRLARYRNQQSAGAEGSPIPVEVIERPPSAELAAGQLDQDSLPEYNILDRILEHYVEQDMSAEAIIARGFREQEVKHVLRLVDLNEYKRRQSPPGVRLTRRGFGRDRRYPITNAWPLGD